MAKTDRQRIVYVEDDSDMIELVDIMLDQDRFDLVGATNGMMGLQRMREAPTALVLLDLMLPDISGWGIYQMMKDDPKLDQIPIIVITAQNTPTDRILGEHIAKVQYYLTKPFSPKELRKAVDETLASGSV